MGTCYRAVDAGLKLGPDPRLGARDKPLVVVLANKVTVQIVLTRTVQKMLT
jgi:hypothetical protein